MAKIVIDPITRIEGHLRIETEVDGGQVTKAWSSSTMWRGIELILQGRDPRDAWYFTQRICGVCTTVHALASVRAVENALRIEIPYNAVLLRNLIGGAQYVQDHVIHFYHLHALDWVDIVSALDADPKATADLAQSISDWPKSGEGYFAAVKNKLATFVGAGQLGPFNNAYWGHPAYKLPPEANLMAVAHYLEALDWQRDVIRIHALLGGKNPHLQTYVVGGMALAIDPNSPSAFNAHQLAELGVLFQRAKEFVEKVYIPDLLAVASFYKDWAAIGAGLGNYMAYGDFPLATGDPNEKPDLLYIPRGLILDKDLSTVHPVEHTKVAEYVTHSWYQYDGGDGQSLHPWQGETTANYTGPEPPYEFLETDNKYSWLKSPRYDGRAVEVGPLARMLVAFASPDAPSHNRVQELVTMVLDHLEVGPEALFSTLGRVAARGIETLLLAEASLQWLDDLKANLARGDLRIHNGELWEPSSWPDQAQGFGWHEAPRGGLGHWVTIENGAIKHYQCVVPSTWNGGPRDANDQPGAYEAALVGTPIADPEQPLEVLRTVHSFDPCMACAAHVVDVTGREITSVKVQ
ncbi:MAG: nickel-dependent hydrogenase large subunit [Anaerolineaceae bacterium]|nr:nickel-dependent hydrogenase large subunit [Anaerolineaceae bacterium]MCB9098683.1 nickel-dependent hydrogenase large subunit [Anaerolineales bacterium]